MPLIILTGYPCSGLSYRANQLSKLLADLQDELYPSTSGPETADNTQIQPQKGRYKIHIVNSHDVSHPRTVYDAARSEKEARAVVYGRTKRLLGKDSIVIVDGMNYIKGWRYQLWCESKAAGTTCCVVHVGTPIDQCTKNNEARLQKSQIIESETQPGKGEPLPEDLVDTSSETPTTHDNEEPYPSELLQNLIFRYEEPSTSSRWDKPLFTVPWPDPTPPIGAIWASLTGQPIPSSFESPTSQLNPSSDPKQVIPTATADSTSTTTTAPTRTSRPKIVPHQATMQPPTTDPGALYALEKRTSEIITHIRNFTQSYPTMTSLGVSSTLTDPNSPGISIPIPDVPTPVFIPSSALAKSPTEELAGAGGVLALPRLQRMRRQWVGMNRAYAGVHARSQGSMGPEQVGEAFVRFLNGEFESIE